MMVDGEEVWPGESIASLGDIADAPRSRSRIAPAKNNPRKTISRTDAKSRHEEQRLGTNVDEDKLAHDFALRAKEQLENQERLHQQERFQLEEQRQRRQEEVQQLQNQKLKYLPVFKPMRDWESELAQAHAEVAYYQDLVEEMQEELGWLRQHADESFGSKRLSSDGTPRRLKVDAAVQCGHSEGQIEAGAQTDIGKTQLRTVEVQCASILTSTVPIQTDPTDSEMSQKIIHEASHDAMPDIANIGLLPAGSIEADRSAGSQSSETHSQIAGRERLAEDVVDDVHISSALEEPIMTKLLPTTARLVRLGPSLGFGGWKWSVAALGKDDHIYCPPCDASHVLRIEPGTQKVELIGPDLGSGRWKWAAASLGDDGRVYCPPRDAQHVLCIDTLSGQVQLIGPDFGVTETKWLAAATAADGHVYCPPCDASRVLRIEPSTGVVDLVGPDLGIDEGKWMAAVLGSDGNVYCPPSNASQVLRITPRIPETGQESTIAMIGIDLGLEPQKFLLALVGGDGCVYCPPYNYNKVMRIQPESGVCEFVGPDFGSEKGKWAAGAVDHQGGNMFCPPCDASSVLKINAKTLDIELIGPPVGIGEDKWRTAVSGNDGFIYALPCDASRALCIDPSSSSVELIGEEWGGRWKVVAAMSGTDGHIYCPPYNVPNVLMLQIDLVTRQGLEKMRAVAQLALTKFKQDTEGELARRKMRIQLLQNDVHKLKHDAKRDVTTMKKQQADMEELQADILRERTSHQDEPQRRADAETVVRAQRLEIEAWRCSHTAVGRPQLLAALPDRHLLSMAQSALRLTSHTSACSGGKSMQSATVLRVQRIVNNQLWSAYERSKYEARKKPARPATLSPGNPAALLQSFQWFADQLEDRLNERLAFHGCLTTAARRVAKDGFDFRLDGGFGQGAYFAEDSCRAFEDCREERSPEEYCLILARLMLGEAYEAQQSFEAERPPSLSNGKAFDSVVVHPGTPSKDGSIESHRLFVTFSKSQSYPEIAIFFKV